MSWEWSLTIYLTLGVLLSEGFIQNSKKTKTRISLRSYFVVAFLGPILIWPVMIIRAFKKPK